MKRAAIGGLVACSIAVYAVLAVIAHANRYLPVDLAITLGLQHLRSVPLDVAMAFVSWFGYFPEFVPEFALVLYVLYRLRLVVEAVVMTVAELGVAVQGFVVKPLVGRPRPSTGLVWVNDALSSDPYSFTAGHVHTFVVIFGFIIFLAARRMRAGWRRTFTIVGSATFLLVTGISRIYLGDHWPLDVLGGYCAGGAWLGLAILAYMELLKRGVIRESAEKRSAARP